MLYGIFVNGKLCARTAHPRETVEAAYAGEKNLQVVVLVQPVGYERRLYQIVAFVAANPDASAVDVNFKFNVSLGGAIKLLCALEKAGLITSRWCIEQGHKQVRRYSVKEQ
jgi:hypothetical protein